jgi:hypothetical protein
MRILKFDAAIRRELEALRRLAATRRVHSLQSDLKGGSVGGLRLNRGRIARSLPTEGVVLPLPKGKSATQEG